MVQAAADNIAAAYKRGELNLVKALSGKQLSSFNREDSLTLGAVVTLYILQILNAYNLESKPNEDEAAGIAEEIIRDYWGMKLAEFPLFVGMAQRGELGKVYGRIDKAIIFDWLRAYEEWKGERLDELHATIKEDSVSPPASKVQERLLGIMKTEARKARKQRLQELEAARIAARQQQVEADKELRQEKNRVILLRQLLDWFPKQMSACLGALERMNPSPTTEQFLEFRKIKLLIEKMKEAKRA